MSGLPPYELIRSDRRTLALQVCADGRLVVRAPRRMPEARIRAFVEEKRGWIERCQRTAAAREALCPPVRTEEGAALPWLGGSLTLRFADVKAPEVSADALLLPPQADADTLRAWMKEAALRLFTARAQALSAQTGLRYSALHVTGAKTRWGSCSGKNSLSFSFRLAMCSPEAIDYVIVHELCHTRHKNHGPAFWALVEHYLPDWRVQRQWLRDHRNLMDAL